MNIDRLIRWGIVSELLNHLEVKEDYSKNDDFSSEEAFCDYLELNMDNICRDIFGSKLIGYKRESVMHEARNVFPRTIRKGYQSRIDFLVKCESGRFLLEAKMMKNTGRECGRCVSQMLDYILTCEEWGVEIKEAWIFTTRIHETMPKLITRFDLPIKLCVISREKMAIFKNDQNYEEEKQRWTT